MSFSRVQGTRRVGTALLVIALGGTVGCDALKPPTACSVSVAPASITLPVNGATTIVGTAFNCDGNSIRNKRVSFSSSNSAVATVTSEGNVIAVSVGTAQVSATADGKSASVQVTVTPEQAATVTLSPSTVTLRRTNTRQFTAVARNSQNVVISGRTFRWASSNSATASVDQNGVVTALAPGNVIISAESDQTTGTANVIVTEIPVGSCSLNPTNTKITVSQQTQPAVTLRDTANNVLSNTNRPIAWSSDNEVAATVSGSGLVTGRRAGTSRITASSVEYPSVTCQANVEVVDARIVTARITPTSGSLRLGIPRQFASVLTDSVGGNIPAGRVVSWTSATPTIATVNSTGLVTGLALGTARIAINAEGATDTLTLQVTRVPVTIVRVSPTSSSVIQGGTVQLSTTIEDSTGTTVTDRTVEWVSSDPTRATVSGTGLVTTLAPGSVTITATSENRSGNASVTIQPIPVDSIAVSPATYSFALNAANKSFAIRLLDSNGNQLFNRSVNVQSTTPSVATAQANSQGTVISINASIVGTTTITLRALNSNGQPEGKTSTVTITITAATTGLKRAP
ncbi:Ig-like domain-containing protein [Gemmatimonas phototrophica]|uniref:Ig-like domain-containing protein n=1 Tax=Gemmatimonas phototrophica TaxID=1379270 RepID=UPI001314E563|nr:Ig-like domain-containing protein [Gemmatimonas phototrophica]